MGERKMYGEDDDEVGDISDEPRNGVSVNANQPFTSINPDEPEGLVLIEVTPKEIIEDVEEGSNQANSAEDMLKDLQTFIDTKFKRQAEKKNERKPVRKKLTYPEHYGLLDIRIGKIMKVIDDRTWSSKPHYIHSVDVGEDVPRVIISHLHKFYTIEELNNRFVLVFCNVFRNQKHHLKTWGWLLCANNGERLELLKPPRECEEGDQVIVEGYPKNPKAAEDPFPRRPARLKIFADIKVNSERVVEYKGIPLTVNGLKITTDTLTDCTVTDALSRRGFPPVP